jgi:ABC-2 type transport system ATP-binding protein
VNAIEVSGLRKVFGEVVAVDGLDFAVPQGKVVGLLGGNGAGKTTTMLKHRYRVLGRMNFSSPYVDLPHRLTVKQNLQIYARLYGVKAIDARVDELAKELDIVGFLARPYGQLSAGQKTRVTIAKALVNQPDVLLLDEPTASLDPDTADWVRGLLKAYQGRTGASILLASHNMTEVERLCDNVLVMRAGKIVEQGAPQELIDRFGRTTMEEVFLDIARNRRQAAQ